MKNCNSLVPHYHSSLRKLVDWFDVYAGSFTSTYYCKYNVLPQKNNENNIFLKIHAKILTNKSFFYVRLCVVVATLNSCVCFT